MIIDTSHLKQLRPGYKVKLKSCLGSSSALAIMEAYQQNPRQILVITPDANSAYSLIEGLKLFGGANASVHLFPDWEILPYDHFSPHQDITSVRMRTLSHLARGDKGITVVPLHTLLHYVMPKKHLLSHHFDYKVGMHFSVDKQLSILTDAGYRSVKQISTPGEFALRGGVLDIFPNGYTTPIRLDLFDDEISSLRTFDVETQLSIDKVDSIEIMPAREFPLDSAGIKHFRSCWRELFNQAVVDCPLYQSVSEGIPFSGIEYYLPLFYEKMSSLFDYIHEDAIVVTVDDLHKHAQHQWLEIEERYEQLRYDIRRPILPPKSLFLATDHLFSELNRFGQLNITTQAEDDSTIHPLPEINIDSQASEPLGRLKKWLDKMSGWRFLLCAESTGRLQVLKELITKSHLSAKIFKTWNDFLESDCPFGLLISPIDAGFEHAPSKVAIIAEAQLYGRRVLQRRRRTNEVSSNENAIADLSELSIGAPIVHYDHGIGRYLGLQRLNLGPYEDEYMILEYASGDKIYVPVSSLHLLSRYTGADSEAVQLTKLGTEAWDRAKRKAAEKAADVAAELLNIYAKRSAKPGFSFSDPQAEYTQFCSAFGFEETPDQEQAINATLKDMYSDRPMDRLVCGDVGFGKTEVAMRAAFVAVQSGKQVVVLVPTTLLAQQHYQTFCDRFSDWPVKISVLSRFQTGKQSNNILDELASGKTDIVVGTHKLLQADIQFANLGLVIVDEEHRFGVKQKERLKSMRAEVDFLALTATPIPRTLNMALSSIRDLSIIATPPAKRLSIKTFVQESNPIIVREAILRELMRGGQVYYLHNDVASIEKTADKIRELVPESKVEIAHGQMSERQLESVMSAFYHQQFNILVCTTIVETGIDVPTANTIIMDRADKLGLAQLHQLRGRVGRSHHQAYAYCFTPPKKQMTADAEKRLNALASLEDLGAGFALATHDLEIRGAGELLGEGQSGNVQSVGFSLYMALLERAVEALNNGEKINLDTPLHFGAEVDLKLPAIIPDDYIPDVDTRLVLYKRIASAKSEKALESIQVEMIDRFGLLPAPVDNLFKITLLKLKAAPIGMKKIEAADDRVRFVFLPDSKLDAEKLITMIQCRPKEFQLKGTEQLLLQGQFSSADKKFAAVEEVLKALLPAN